MKFTLYIFKKDKRYKNNRRCCGTYTFERRTKQDMDRDVKELNMLYKESDGYILETKEEK